MLEKRCSTCKETKHVSEFRKNKSTNDGYSSQCKVCARISGSKHYLENKNSIIKKRLHVRDNDPYHYRAIRTLLNHKKLGHTINVELHELENLFKSSTICSICGKELNFEFGNTKHDTPSLDRIDNEKELRLDNLWIVCHSCNTAKSSKTMIEFYEYCKLIVERYEHGCIKN